uniref:HSF-type DNA-binding domain-containing protein n=1 Tax=Cyclophora tenuis TaxID=216820 RepID=A0A7S1D3P4_CYCTE|mmetsp:Transcript_21506/g.36636  ORF Transcript_21506/g.36636 Transcript_21506/m.36636 type:complete len:290 (+) Transcript_21506:625-1494(+)
MEILCDRTNHDAIAWLPHGRAFIIVNRQKFANTVLPKYFRKTKYTSFTRKLNRWNFTRVTRGPELGAYYHEFFQRGKEALCTQMYCKNERAKFAVSSKDSNNNNNNKSNRKNSSKPTESVLSGPSISSSTTTATTQPTTTTMSPPTIVQCPESPLSAGSELLQFTSTLSSSKPVTPSVNPAVQARMMMSGGYLNNNNNNSNNNSNQMFGSQDPVTSSILDSALSVLHQGAIPQEVSHALYAQTPLPEMLMLRAQIAALQHQQQQQRQLQQQQVVPQSGSSLYNCRASAA